MRRQSAHRPFDVAIIGAGVVGCAIARALSRFELRVALVDRQNDVGAETSKANSAILHTGFDMQPGTVESRLVSEGHAALTRYAEAVGIPLYRVGALMIAWSGQDQAGLRSTLDHAARNGYRRTRVLSPAKVYALEPNLAQGLAGAVDIPDESIICPFSTSLALATEAVTNGVALLLNRPITRAERTTEGGWCLYSGGRHITAEWVVNAAGLRGDEVDGLFDRDGASITPRRGEFLVYDKPAADLLTRIILDVPNPRTKGVLVAPTVFGNVLVGPTAEDVRSKTDTDTTAEGIRYLIERGTGILPALEQIEVTSTYAGLRAVAATDQYEIDVDQAMRYAWALGIRSTGLTAAMAIADHLLHLLEDAGLPLRPGGNHVPIEISNIGEGGFRPYREDAAIGADPDAGHVVCFCEQTTLAEVRAATSSQIPARTIDALRRRTRATGGKCQGFYCRANLVALMAGLTGATREQLIGLDHGEAQAKQS